MRSAMLLSAAMGKADGEGVAINAGKVMEELMPRLADAIEVVLVDGQRDWTGFVRDCIDTDLARGETPAGLEALEALRVDLNAFGVTQSRRSAALARYQEKSSKSAGTVALIAGAEEFWPSVNRVDQPTTGSVGTDYVCQKSQDGCGFTTRKKMSWCPSCGKIRPGAWSCTVCKMTSMGEDQICRFRVYGGCPGSKERTSRPATSANTEDKLRISLMKESRVRGGQFGVGRRFVASVAADKALAEELPGEQ